MADKKISALTGASTPLAGTEVLPIVQSGATVKVAVSNLTAGRAISAASVTASTGNFVVGTSGQGIDFSATPGTGTSELFADYEEGTWTPVVGGNATYTSQSGTYTKIGRLVTLQFFIQINVLGTGSATQLSGFPYNAGSVGFGQSGSISLWGNIATNVVWLGCYINSSAAVMNFTGNGIIASGTTTYNGITIFGDNAYVQGTISYTV